MTIQRGIAVIAIMVALLSAPFACAASAKTDTGVDSGNPIAPGTIINMQNWRQYQNYMSYGMQQLFEGTYHWKFPADFELAVEATQHYPLGSRQYIENTEKYANQVRIVSLPDGGHDVANYTAGLPFPNPSEPLKGWKILVNDWFAYQPYILCTNANTGHFEDRFGDINELTTIFVERRMAHISDPGQPINEPKAPGEDFVQYFQVEQPEQSRYTGILTIYFYDLTKPEASYVFVPSLRRTLRLATTARCSPVLGSDFTYDDTRHGAFNGNITKFDAKFLGNRKILEGPDQNLDVMMDMDNYYKPVLFGKPSVVKFQVRDTYVIDVRRIPALSAGYCYGKRILYVDRESMQAMWADLYDSNMKLWKIDYDPQAILPVQGVGKIWTNEGWGVIYDIQNEHLSHVLLPLTGGDACHNVGGTNFTDITRYSSVNGLSMIMR